MIAIVDYGVGNLFSLSSSLRAIGQDVVITGSEEELHQAERIILPGVGAFGDAAALLRSKGLDRVLRREVEEGKALMGICLGMQLLFESSLEFGEHQGLGFLKGRVVPMQGRIPPDLKIPQIGWNSLHLKKSHPLLKEVSEGDCVYFVHSFYAADCDDSLLATTDYGIEMTAMVAKDKISGCQFHPEKSGKVGLKILKAFCESGCLNATEERET